MTPRETGAVLAAAVLAARVPGRTARSAVLVAVVAVAGLPAQAAAAQGHADPASARLLARHAPVLRYDARERSPAVAVEAIRGGRLLAGGRAPDRPLGPERLGRRYPNGSPARRDDGLDLPPPGRTSAPATAYGRIARGSDGRRWLQYWLFFLANDQDRSPLRTGRHEGDWELAQVRLAPDGRPDRLTLSQHSWAQGCAWREAVREGERPVVHVAHASHALYAHPGTGDRPWPDPNDEAPGDGATARPAVVPIAAATPAWVGWPGRWGASEPGIVPGEHPSPRGPAFQPQRRWSDPSRFDADHARACDAGPPPRPGQSTVLKILGALALAVAVVLNRRASEREEEEEA